MAKVINNHSVVTNKALVHYAHLLEPVAPMNGGEPVYSCCLLIPKDDEETVDAIKQAARAAAEYGKKIFGGKIPNNLRFPLRDGDDDRADKEGYAGHWFINCKTKRKPTIVDLDKHVIEDPSQIYSGMYVKAILNFYAYSQNGNKGIGCSLGDMQKVEDGTKIGGVVTFNDAFSSATEDSMPF